jgi:hypothetical protein
LPRTYEGDGGECFGQALYKITERSEVIL